MYISDVGQFHNVAVIGEVVSGSEIENAHYQVRMNPYYVVVDLLDYEPTILDMPLSFNANILVASQSSNINTSLQIPKKIFLLRFPKHIRNNHHLLSS